MRVGDKVLYGGKKYHVIGRVQNVFELRKVGLFGIFRKHVQIYLRESTVYQVIKG